MTELDNTQGQNNGTGTENEQNEQTRTYTQDEVNDLLQRETDRRVSAALAKAERKTQQKLAEAERLSRMDEQQRWEYSLQKKEQELLEKERSLERAERKAVASRILAEKGLPQDFTDYVIEVDDAEQMNARISGLDRAYKQAVKIGVEQRLGGQKSPAVNNNAPLTKERFNDLSLQDRQKLYDNDRELYMSLSGQS